MDTLNDLIDKIQVARADTNDESFPSLLNDVMIALGWTENQAADRLRTSEVMIGKWMSGRSPTDDEREFTYQYMLCGLVEQDVVNEMTTEWVQRNHYFGWSVAIIVIGGALLFALLIKYAS